MRRGIDVEDGCRDIVWLRLILDRIGRCGSFCYSLPLRLLATAALTDPLWPPSSRYEGLQRCERSSDGGRCRAHCCMPARRLVNGASEDSRVEVAQAFANIAEASSTTSFEPITFHQLNLHFSSLAYYGPRASTSQAILTNSKATLTPLYHAHASTKRSSLLIGTIPTLPKIVRYSYPR